MCDLCSSDEQELKKAKYHHNRVAAKLNRLATSYRDLSTGVLKPHSIDAQNVSALACSVIRDLVEDWV